jgi:hypothetical protein
LKHAIIQLGKHRKRVAMTIPQDYMRDGHQEKDARETHLIVAIAFFGFWLWLGLDGLWMVKDIIIFHYLSYGRSNTYPLDIGVGGFSGKSTPCTIGTLVR